MEKKIEVVSIRLVKDAPVLSNTAITKPEDAIRLLGEKMCELDREVVCIINMKANGIPINCNFVSMGAVNYCVCNPADVFKSAILSNATSMLMLHNHPSGLLTPSKEDCMVTDQILKAGKIIGIKLLDHIIVGGDNKNYFSLRENGLIDYSPERYSTQVNDLEFPEIIEKNSQKKKKTSR